MPFVFFHQFRISILDVEFPSQFVVAPNYSPFPSNFFLSVRVHIFIFRKDQFSLLISQPQFARYLKFSTEPIQQLSPPPSPPYNFIIPNAPFYHPSIIDSFDVLERYRKRFHLSYSSNKKFRLPSSLHLICLSLYPSCFLIPSGSPFISSSPPHGPPTS